VNLERGGRRALELRVKGAGVRGAAPLTGGAVADVGEEWSVGEDRGMAGGRGGSAEAAI
jgi:hypothetical protein